MLLKRNLLKCMYETTFCIFSIACKEQLNSLNNFFGRTFVSLFLVEIFIIVDKALSEVMQRDLARFHHEKIKFISSNSLVKFCLLLHSQKECPSQ